MRATVLEIFPTLSSRARLLTRMKPPGRKGRNTSPRERLLLVGRSDDVTNFISKASVTRQKSAA